MAKSVSLVFIFSFFGLVYAGEIVVLERPVVPPAEGPGATVQRFGALAEYQNQNDDEENEPEPASADIDCAAQNRCE
jgi:hypothetical protein